MNSTGPTYTTDKGSLASHDPDDWIGDLNIGGWGRRGGAVGGISMEIGGLGLLVCWFCVVHDDLSAGQCKGVEESGKE